MTTAALPAARTPGWFRRLACATYDALLVTAVVLLASLPVAALAGDVSQDWRKHLLQAYIVAVIGAYFVICWSRNGQTLALRTWRMRIVRVDGQPLGAGTALRRYAYALLGLAVLGLGFLWALVDREGQCLHDRLAGTRLTDLR